MFIFIYSLFQSFQSTANTFIRYHVEQRTTYFVCSVVCMFFSSSFILSHSFSSRSCKSCHWLDWLNKEVFVQMKLVIIITSSHHQHACKSQYKVWWMMRHIVYHSMIPLAIVIYYFLIFFVVFMLTYYYVPKVLDLVRLFFLLWALFCHRL